MIDGTAPCKLSFAKHSRCSLGSYSKFYLAILCAFQGENKTLPALHFNYCVFNNPRTSTLKKLLWSLHSSDYDINIIKQNGHKGIISQGKEILLEMQLPTEILTVPGSESENQFLAIANAHYNNKQFPFKSKSIERRLDYKPSHHFKYNAECEIGELFGKLEFKPHHWTYYDKLEVDIGNALSIKQ